ncbi:MAG TPA: MauE/DoxX family redox-associated membrane protein [Dehalococcoidia bacterium]|nr:MauE/DoxX family redox-associated membrane protein [Dehalococcoidia bacterium]
MGLALLLARILLAVVFAAAAVAKLADQAGARQALRGLGAPQRGLVPDAWLLPIFELAVAVLLVPVATAWVAGIVAFVLLLLFSGAVVLSLARGRRPVCHCFGQIAAAPLGRATVVRNLLLLGVAGFVVLAGRQDAGIDVLGWVGGGSMLAWIGFVLGAAALVVSVVVLVLLVQLLAQNGRLLARLEGMEGRLALAPAAAQTVAGLPVGTAAPEFALDDLEGNAVTLASLRAGGKPVLLAFLDPACGPCKALFPDVVRWQRELADRVMVVCMSRGALRANRSKAAALGLSAVLVQQSSEVAHPFGVYYTPSMVLVLPDGRIGSPVAQGVEDVRALVARQFGPAATESELSVVGAS